MDSPKTAPAPGRQPSRLTRYTARALAVALPIVVFLCAGGFLAGRDSVEAREIGNAGKVINGRVVRNQGVVSTIEHVLDRNEPDVIILGNSLSNTDINPAQLARDLSIPKSKIQRFSIPNSIGAHWYLILKERVYANKHAPKVVMLLSDMQSLLATVPSSQASYLNLIVHLDERRPDPVVTKKTGSQTYASSRIMENKGRAREDALKLFRNLAVDVFMRGTLYSGQQKATDSALDRVFDAGNTDVRLHNAVIPIMNDQRGLEPFDASALAAPDDGYIPDIVKMVSRHDGTLVCVRPPMSPLLDARMGDNVDPAREQRVYEIVNENGGAYLDLRGITMGADHFYNVDHMNELGAKRFTEAIAQSLITANVMKLDAEAAASRKREIELFGQLEIGDDGVMRQVDAEVQFKKPPIEVPRPVRPVQETKGQQAYIVTDGFAFLSDVTTQQVHPFGSRCSPLRLLEDGKELPLPNVSCEEVFKTGRGRMCHNTDRVLFSSTDNTDPVKNKREYRLGLDPDRSCEGAVWVYPRDALRVSFPVDRLRPMPGGAKALRIDGVDMRGSDKPTMLEVKLTVDGKVVVEGTFEAARFLAGPMEWQLEPITRAREIVLEVRNPSNGFALLTSAVLSERRLASVVPDLAPLEEDLAPSVDGGFGE